MNIVTLESSQYLETPQWRLSFQGLGREGTVTISFNGSSYQCSEIETEDSLSWIIQESKTPLELLFDLGRIEVADSFSFDISSEVNTNVTWILEALNSDESWSAGSQELESGIPDLWLLSNTNLASGYSLQGPRRAPTKKIGWSPPERRG